MKNQPRCVAESPFWQKGGRADILSKLGLSVPVYTDLQPMKHRIEDDAKIAMKSGDKPRLAVLRLILSEIKRIEIDSRAPLDEAGILDTLAKMAKQRRESIKQFADAGRADLQEKENFELEVITSYMPKQLDETELEALINEAIDKTGATGIRDMSKVMAEIKAQARGSADLSAVGRIVKAKLTSA